MCRALHHDDPDRLPPVTNGDVLELLNTFRASEKASIVPVLHEHLMISKYIPNGINVKCLWGKINDTERQFAKLKKNHNARCSREGSHQTLQLNNFLGKAFYPSANPQTNDKCTILVDNILPVSLQADFQTTKQTSEFAPSTPGRESLSSTVENNKETTRPIMSNAGVQVASPQIRTEGQVRRIERKVKRQLLFSNKKVDSLQHKVEMREEKKGSGADS